MGWSRHGPLPRRALPALSHPGWTVLVQGLDLHVPAAHELLRRFRFVPDARLDDLMLSYASDGGGVGPHLDSYDVFLIQVHGRRRWRIGRARDRAFVDGLPLKILRHFEPEQEWLLEPGDMLYLPPHWAHDGVAVGECMTCVGGFPRRRGPAELARELLVRLADAVEPAASEGLYGDAATAGDHDTGRDPAGAARLRRRRMAQGLARSAGAGARVGRVAERAQGAGLVRPCGAGHLDPWLGVVLDRRTRMLYDARHVYLNGEAFRASGGDARLLRRLADERRLAAGDLQRLSAQARALIADLARAGWLHRDEVP